MRKWMLLQLLLFFAGIIFAGRNCFAQEQVTITTYYPSPYGIYREMRTDFLAVGSTYRTTPAYSDGTLVVSGNTGLGVPAPTQKLDVDGNINVRGSQVRMGNSANHYYGDGTNLAARVAGDFYVQNQAGSGYRYIYAADVYLGAPQYGTAKWASQGTCQRLTFTASSGNTLCPAGTSITQGPLVSAQTSGVFLCCSYY